MTDDQQSQVHHQTIEHLCGAGTLLKLNLKTAVITVVPLLCKSWSCPKCGPKLVGHWRRKIAETPADRFITLTVDTNRFSSPEAALIQMKSSFAKLVRTLRSYGHQFEYVAVWEFTKKGWPHVHVLQRGDYVPQSLISKKWSYYGIGKVVDIRKIQTPHGAAQELTKYLLKSTQSASQMLPNMRLIQASRHFFSPLVEAPRETLTDTVRFIFCRFCLATVLATLERHFHYHLIQMDHSGTATLHPQHDLTIYNSPPEGFEALDELLKPFRLSFLTSPPPEGLTWEERHSLYGL